MGSLKPSTPTSSRPPVFAISCWALALMAFSQLLVSGMALATRFEESRDAKVVIKEVPKYIAVRVPAAPVESASSSAVVSRPPLPAPAVSQPLPAPTPVTAPIVGDPRSERMVREARQARVAGDMDVAITKLEEALTQSPDDPNVHFELGVVHEQMGVFDTAAAHYEKVFQMGVSGAGALYEKAAAKLRDGFEEPSVIGKLSLGQVRIFKDPNDEAGQRVILTIPTQKAPGEDLELDQVSVEVMFFNRTSKGEIIKLEDESWVTERKWMNLPFDFTEGEENLRMTYVLPKQDYQTEHLFGERSYYGQVVSLLYKGEVVDVRAWPPHLASKVTQPPTVPQGDMLPDFQNTLPPDFDPNLPLLPPLPTQ
ncbi:MAG: tetratricopeptide repeat protein [Verrucomicrobiota bacterium]